jgi:3',5'-cyclic AMP phosphodiesterase CpdA
VPAAALLQISDPHFGTEQPPVVAALLELARHVRPELVVVSGDVTQRARAAQFAAAGRFVTQLPTHTVLAIPGNHDIPLFNVFARAFNPYRGFRATFGANLEPQYSSDAFAIACLNTTRPRRHKDGEMSPEQIARAAAFARSAKVTQLRIVVVHQPVHVIRTQDVENLLHGHREAVCAWAAAGVDIVMGGHIHLPYVRTLGNHSVDLKRRIWAVQAGTAVSNRVRHEAPNSVNVLKYEAGAPHAVIEQWNYAALERAFVCAERIEVELDRGSTVGDG